MRFIDRDSEQARLRKQFETEHCGFIVIYGRRRLGKSALIRHILKEDDIYYMPEKNVMAVQMAMMTKTRLYTG